jgi:hypothetical protein
VITEIPSCERKIRENGFVIVEIPSRERKIREKAL